MTATADPGRDLRLERVGAVAVLTIIAEPLGVLRRTTKVRFGEIVDHLERDPEVRAIVIQGHGRAFSVGSDIREFQPDPAWQAETLELEHQLYFRLESSRLPMIAACNGLTLGGGAELALACDIRLAAESATFGFPEVMVGQMASGGGTQRLPAVVGPGRAAELLMTGRTFPASEAFDLRLVEEVVPDADLYTRATELATTISERPLFSVAATKRALHGDPVRNRPAGYALEEEMSVALGCSELAAEGQAAFLEKRLMRLDGDAEEWLAWNGTQSAT